MSKLRSIITLGICIVLFATLISSNIILATDGGSYDPWIDLNDDGIIDAIDLQALASIYGASGTPINKTELLLELETRLNNLNASLLKEYYNITDCDSLFALLSHLHSGSDISGGTLRADQIKIGSSEASQIIYFYEDGSEIGEFICWHDANDRFWVSEDIYIEGTVTIPTTTRYYSMPGSAWLPLDDAYEFTRLHGCIFTDTDGLTVWYAPVNLPHGAVVTQFKAWIDDSALADVDVYLARHLHGDSSADGMASISSAGSHYGFVEYTDNTINYATVDNENYSYHVSGYLSTGNDTHKLSDIRIAYTITEPLP